MNKSEILEDLSFLMYLVPFLVSGAYAFYSAYPQELPIPPSEAVYLAVTKSPEVFAIGSVCVMAGLLLRVVPCPPVERHRKILEAIGRLQWVAVSSFGLAIVSALSTMRFSGNVSAVFSLVLEGRYALVFPLFMLILSFLISPAVSLGKVVRIVLSEEGPLILALASPVVMFALWKASLSPSLAFVAGIVVAGIAAAIIAVRPPQRK